MLWSCFKLLHCVCRTDRCYYASGGFRIILKYLIQHCLICSPSDPTVSEDAIGLNPGLLQGLHALARSQPHIRICTVSRWLSVDAGPWWTWYVVPCLNLVATGLLHYSSAPSATTAIMCRPFFCLGALPYCTPSPHPRHALFQGHFTLLLLLLLLLLLWLTGGIKLMAV